MPPSWDELWPEFHREQLWLHLTSGLHVRHEPHERLGLHVRHEPQWLLEPPPQLTLQLRL